MPPRAPMHVPVEILRRDGVTRWYRLTTHVAVDSLRLAHVVPDELDGPLSIAFHLPGDARPVRCSGRAVEEVVGDGEDERAERRGIALRRPRRARARAHLTATSREVGTDLMAVKRSDVDPLKRLEEMKRRALEGGGDERIAKQHAAGKLTARERIELLARSRHASSSSTSSSPTAAPTSAWRSRRSSATAWSPATASSTAARSSSSRRTSPSSAARSPAPTRRRSARSWTWR